MLEVVDTMVSNQTPRLRHHCHRIEQLILVIGHNDQYIGAFVNPRLALIQAESKSET